MGQTVNKEILNPAVHGNTVPRHRVVTADRRRCNLHQNSVIVRLIAVAYPGILFGGGGSTNSVEDKGQKERVAGGGRPLVRGSGGSCNLVQKISFHIVKFS